MKHDFTQQRGEGTGKRNVSRPISDLKQQKYDPKKNISEQTLVRSKNEVVSYEVDS